MTREELIVNTFAGSVIAYANFETFYWRNAIRLILKDKELTNEVCEQFNLSTEMLEGVMTSQVNEEQAILIGQRLEATMETEPMW